MKKINSSLMIFLITAIMYAVGNFIWWKMNSPVWGSALHFLDIFMDGWLFYNAPLLTWIMKGMFYVFGKGNYDLQVIFVNYIFFLISLYFIYKIGSELKDKETGNIAMILFAMVPAVYGMSRQYGHKEYHLIAVVTFNIYCLIKTDYFRNRKWTIWYGVSVGLGLMIKDAFLAYFFVPFIYGVIAGLRENVDKKKIINILISIAMPILISGYHYSRLSILKKIWYDPQAESHPLFAFESLRVMTTGLWEELLSPPIFIIFIIGLIFFIFKYRGKYKNIILIWFFVPWTIIMLMPHHKLPEYGAGFIPMMVLIAAIIITAIRKQYFKKILVILLIFIGFLQYIHFSYFSFVKIFDIKLKIKEYKISYYNKYNRLMAVNRRQTELILKLVKYFKVNYGEKTFFIEQPCIVLDKYDIVGQMFLNDIAYAQWISDDSNVLLADIIIVIGVQNTVEEKKQYAIKQILINPMLAKKFNKTEEKKVIKRTEDIVNQIKQIYYPIDVFYLEENNEDLKIMLFGRKNKFLHFLQ